MSAISIILPTYNAENYIADTLKSILNQTFSDIEVICIDDGSTDSTPYLLKRMAQEDHRIVTYTQNNTGPGAARNAGLEHAHGDYVAMLDADDIYCPTMLESLHAEATRIDADVVVSRSSQFDDSTGQELESWWTLNINQIPTNDHFGPMDMRDFVFTAFIGWPWDKLYKRSFIEEHNIRYPTLSNSEDLYFVFLALAKANTIGIVEEPLIQHRVNREGSVSSSRSKDPLAFYKSTCLLKHELQKDPTLYSALSWGFLNWAFGYMLWNIETMTDSSARRIQLDALLNDRFPELEIPLHSPAFFSLEPSAYDRYLALLCEASGRPIPENKNNGILSKLIKLLSCLQERGLAATTARAFRWLMRRATRKKRSTSLKTQTQIRGKDYSVSGKGFASIERGINGTGTDGSV